MFHYSKKLVQNFCIFLWIRNLIFFPQPMPIWIMEQSRTCTHKEYIIRVRCHKSTSKTLSKKRFFSCLIQVSAFAYAAELFFEEYHQLPKCYRTAAPSLDNSLKELFCKTCKAWHYFILMDIHIPTQTEPQLKHYGEKDIFSHNVEVSSETQHIYIHCQKPFLGNLSILKTKLCLDKHYMLNCFWMIFL